VLDIMCERGVSAEDAAKRNTSLISYAPETFAARIAASASLTRHESQVR
jgi:hypothetical protein